MHNGPDKSASKQVGSSDSKANQENEDTGLTNGAASSNDGSVNASLISRFGGSFEIGAGVLPMQPVPRAIEDGPVRGLVGVLGEGRFRHYGPVENVVLSPDGKFLAAATEGPALWMWDTATGTPLYVIAEGEHHELNAVMSFSPDGRTLAVFGNYMASIGGRKLVGGVLRLIDVPTGQTRIRREGYMQYLRNNFGQPVTLEFSPNGKLLALDMGQCFLVETETGNDSSWMSRFPVSPGTVTFQRSPLISATFATDGRHMVLAVSGVAGANDPKNFITGNRVAANPVIVCDLQTGKETFRLPERNSLSLYGLAQKAPLLEVLQSASRDYELRNMQGEIHWKIATRDKPGKFMALDNERVLYLASSQVNTQTTSSAQLLNFRTGDTHLVSEPYTSITDLQTFQLFHSRILGYTLFNPPRVAFYDLDEKKLRATIPVELFPEWSKVAVSKDGLFAAFVDARNGTDRSQLRILDLNSGQVLHTLHARRFNGAKGTFNQVHFAPDSSRIYASLAWRADLPGEIGVWTLPDGKRLFQSPISPYDPGQIAFSPSGRLFAAGTLDDGRIHVWNLADASVQKIFGDGDDSTQFPLQSMAFSPDASLLMTHNRSHARMFELAGPRVRFTKQGSLPTHLSFTADGTTVVTSRGLLDSTTGDPIDKPELWRSAQSRDFPNFTSAPAHHTVAGKSEYGPLVLFDIKNGQPPLQFQSPHGSVAFLNNPLRLALWNNSQRNLALIDLKSGRDGLTVAETGAGEETQSSTQTNLPRENSRTLTRNPPLGRIPKVRYQTVALESDEMPKPHLNQQTKFIGGDRIAEVRPTDGLLKVWSAQSGKLLFAASICPPKPEDPGSRYIPFHTLNGTFDGRYVAVSMRNGQILFFDLTAAPVDPSLRPKLPAIAARPPVSQIFPPPGVGTSPTSMPTPKPKPPTTPSSGPADEQAKRLRELLKPQAKFEGKWTFEKYSGRIAFRVTAVNLDGIIAAVLFDPTKPMQTKSIIARIVPERGDDPAEVQLMTLRGTGLRRTPSKTPATGNLLILADQRTIGLKLVGDQLIGTDSVGVEFTFAVRKE